MEITLYYFKIPFWRAEVARLALFIGDISFKDYRFESQDTDLLKKDGIFIFEVSTLTCLCFIIFLRISKSGASFEASTNPKHKSKKKWEKEKILKKF